ncbi:MAG: STAS domain-containing protein [Oscillospiraceae bacterium]|nr:STAS domain-containing protein [Oscillospiraceae bacterium]
MEVQTKTIDCTLTVSFRGELDHHAARETVTALERAVDAALPMHLTLDFGGVTFMDSSGIAVVMRAFRRMSALGGRLELINVPAQAKKVFDAAGITARVPMGT